MKKSVAEQFWDDVCEIFADILKNGDTINLHGYFEMGSQQSRERLIHNLKSGKRDRVIPPKIRPYCRFGSFIRKAVQERDIE